MISPDKAGVQFPDSEISVLLDLGICVQEASYGHIFVWHFHQMKVEVHGCVDDRTTKNDQSLDVSMQQFMCHTPGRGTTLDAKADSH
jgi:hypothetical protein